MKRSRPTVDLAAYVQAVPRLLAHPSTFVAPLIGAAVALLFEYLGQTMTDPLGGIGSGIYQMLATLTFLCALGVATIQASHIWRGRGGSLDDAWQEGRAKFGGILFAAVGIVFVFSAAAYVGSIFGAWLGLLCELAAIFFMIYTVAAAAIGGLPGPAAISGSIRCARTNPVSTAILTVVSIALWIFLPLYVLTWAEPYIITRVTPFGFDILHVLIEAVVLTYFAFPLAKQYDDVAFRAFW